MKMTIRTIITLTCLSVLFITQIVNAEPITSIELKLNEIVLVESENGNALIRFIKYSVPTEKSIYRWRYKSKTDGKETSGNGFVFEKYETTKENQEQIISENNLTVKTKTVIVKDAGGHLFVKAGTISMEWSYGMEGSYGYLYYNPSEFKITKMTDILFDLYKF